MIQGNYLPCGKSSMSIPYSRNTRVLNLLITTVSLTWNTSFVHMLEVIWTDTIFYLVFNMVSAVSIVAKLNCLYYTHDISSLHDKNTQVDIGILDFSKAFDVAPHQRLLNKFFFYGVR